MSGYRSVGDSKVYIISKDADSGEWRAELSRLFERTIEAGGGFSPLVVWTRSAPFSLGQYDDVIEWRADIHYLVDEGD